ncbi:kinase-like protein [Aaosphaeria arxii CBS 175.79]|uniref:non-specific serine/threonine protein kinase n=1 Tax=Aaosphaeria arxii CBS 175.79 TaxID=1450172 RepID=A0A6A5XYB0_9PLEO|nr:kinase-like protein [Aaosphaeria arxii CBS 175.79]KAF2018152.1 kinase-like protein [Aaosphaeria arxii CBS 175.79]
MNLDQAQFPRPDNTRPASESPGAAGVADFPPSKAGDESDNTPRSEVPSTADTVPAIPPELQHLNDEPSYFSPQPLRMYSGSKFSASTPTSTNPSPTTSNNASSTSVNKTRTRTRTASPSSSSLRINADTVGRPGVQRDLSSTSTASVATIRAHSVDPIASFAPLPRQHQRDGPHYPNQSYAALQNQQHYTVHPPHLPRTRSTHPAHSSSHSAAHISTFGIALEYHRDLMESGSRTVGNSPASSPGLFSPTTPPFHHGSGQPDDGHYSSPYLHHTHRQAPKETHTADVDVDPVSGRKIINNYEVIDELGRGVHGKVKLGRNLATGEFVAIKIVDRYSKRRRLGKNTSHEDKIKKEIAILKKARHPNIVSLLEVIDDPSRKKVYIVLEHVELGEVKWRTLGEKEIARVEWRRFQRHSQGIFDNDSADMEDNRILHHARQKLERKIRRRAREQHLRRSQGTDFGGWSFEHGGDSDDDASESSRDQRSIDDRAASRDNLPDTNMETAYRSPTPLANSRQPDLELGLLDGTMYGGYDTQPTRGRAPSLAESSSSHHTDDDEEVPEHFRYVPLMTIQAAREAFRDTVLGLEYLHFQSVIHRDIKPANLLQTKEHRIKISDFGVSYLGRGSSGETTGDQSESDAHDYDEAIELAKTVGTPAFYAPELCRTDLDADDAPPPVGPAIDVWALGVTLYCLIYGRVPFHDHNTFHLMKLITDTDVYIPDQRLKAVTEQSGSRPNSHGRMYHSMTTSKRAPHDLEHEDVGELLRDLLKRLLIKDPRKRITIPEIKRHPWLLQGLDDFHSWVEETDPNRSAQNRIRVTKDDVEQAVVPITLIDRVRSGVRKTIDTMFGMGRRGGSRRRAQSNATNPDPNHPLTANSSSSTISQEGRRPSLAMGQSIFEALNRSREPDHPLSQSVTASPEVAERKKFFESSGSRTGSPAHSLEGTAQPLTLATAFRPLPERANSATSNTTASGRTIIGDRLRSGRPASPIIPPALPGTPTALESPGGTHLGGIFGGAPRRFVNSVRSRESLLKPNHLHSRAKSIDRLVNPEEDAHAGPSLAISNTLAAGHVDQSDLLREMSPGLARGTSPSISDLRSPDPTERAASRQSSVSSAASYHSRMYAAHHQMEVGPTDFLSFNKPQLDRGASSERFNRAKDELVRQRVEEARERPRSKNASRPVSIATQSECPPSPDDEVFFQRQKVEDYLNQNPGSTETSPGGFSTTSQAVALTSSSSEDHFASISQSTSNPSIPSVASANSSVAPDECLQMQMGAYHVAPETSEDSIKHHFSLRDDTSGYDGDHALESGDDEDSGDDDFLVMGKRKTNSSTRSGSISNGELARSHDRKVFLAERQRSSRSGSNGTVKKIPPPEASSDSNTPTAQ